MKGNVKEGRSYNSDAGQKSLSVLPLPRDCVAIRKRAVIPAQAGIQFLILFNYLKCWMPAFAGMTNYDTVSKGGELFLLPSIKDSAFPPLEKGDEGGFEGFSKKRNSLAL